MVLAEDKREELRQRVIALLQEQGFTLREGVLLPPDMEDKERIRALHALSRRERIREAKDWILENEETLLPYFADGKEVDPWKIQPRLEPVDTPLKGNLFRYASLLWSIPISAGYGRRLRFLVMDGNNGKLIGLIGLGDPPTGWAYAMAGSGGTRRIGRKTSTT